MYLAWNKNYKPECEVNISGLNRNYKLERVTEVNQAALNRNYQPDSLQSDVFLPSNTAYNPSFGIKQKKVGLIRYLKTSRYFSWNKEYTARSSDRYSSNFYQYNFRFPTKYRNKLFEKALKTLEKNNYQGNNALFALDFMLRENRSINWKVFDNYDKEKIHKLLNYIKVNGLFAPLQTQLMKFSYYFENDIPYDKENKQRFYKFLLEEPDAHDYIKTDAMLKAMQTFASSNKKADKRLYALDVLLMFKDDYWINNVVLKKTENLTPEFIKKLYMYAVLNNNSSLLEKIIKANGSKPVHIEENEKLNLLPYSDSYYSELKNIANQRILDKIKNIYEQNGILTLSDIEDFINYPNISEIVNSKLNIVGENIAHFLVDLHAEQETENNTKNQISQLEKIFESLSKINKNLAIKEDDFGTTPYSKALEAENEVVVKLFEKYFGKNLK